MSPAAVWLLAAVAVISTALAHGSDDDGMTHLHLYIHETFTGANATAIALAGSPLALGGNNNASFGSIGAFDDALREGADAASQLLGRAEGALVQADLGSPAAWCTVVHLVFTEGDYGGSALVVYGRAEVGAGVVERAVVGGTGRFRRASGYTLMTRHGNSTDTIVVFEMDIYVKMAS